MEIFLKMKILKKEIIRYENMSGASRVRKKE